MENLSGSNIKGYELNERIGAGGFGAVYKAKQSTVGREVAMKIILPHFANHPDFIRRFETEAQLVARLEHLHIVPLYDYWRDPDGAYLIMRWLRGGSLQEALKMGAYSVQAAALVIDQIASALATAHRNQVIHRDLKPANILLDEDGNAYLGDFGIAKDLGTQSSVTEIDAIVGSPDYLSPEQARSEQVTPRTDIYSLGVVLYEMLAGQHPFPNANMIERLYKHLNDPLPALTNMTDEVSDSVNAVIQKATAKNPAHRYADALEFAAAFRQAIASAVRTGVDPVEALTLREQDILRLLIEGQSNKEIAQNLFITVATVKWYIKQIYGKLGVRSRVQAIVRARELNLVGGSAASDTSSSISIPTDQFQPDNPYKGLRAFQSTDYQDFFGREKLTGRLVKRLAETGDGARFLAVVGPSGSGKSSIVKAGLIPAIWRGELPGSEKWFVVEMLPGSRPLDELEVALIRISANQSGSIREQLTRDQYGLLRVANLILPDDGSELLLVIDQFEEVFTLMDDEAARAQFLKLLYAAMIDPRSRVRIVVTLRADFYDRPLHYPDIGELMRNRMETILPLSADGLERAIARPAEQVGVVFEEGLVASIIAEVNYQASALPLLQYALTELFEQRQGRLLTQAAYQTIGRTVGALAKRADEIYQSQDAAAQEATRQMFLRLVTLGEGTDDARRRVARAELLAVVSDTEVMDEVIDTYGEYRLLSFDNDPATRAPTVEVAHEALLREWERLRGWLNESRDAIKLQRQLAAMTTEWQKANQNASYLLHGSRLDEFSQWAATTQLALTATERAYLSTSQTESDRLAQVEQQRQMREFLLERRSRNFLRGLVAVLLLATLGACGLTGVASNSAVVAGQERDSAQANFIRAERIRLSAQAQVALSSGESGEIPVLLALRSLQYGYSPEADSSFISGLSRPFTRLMLQQPDNITSAVFSPDGRYILTSSMDAITRLWDARTGAAIRQFEGHQYVVWSANFSPDGSRIVTGSVERQVRVWDTETGKQLTQLNAPIDVNNVRYSADGKYIIGICKFVFGGDMIVMIWDAESYRQIERYSVITGSWAALSPDNTRLLTVTHSGTLQVMDLASKTVIYEINDPTARWETATYSPDGQTIAAGGTEGLIRLWDAATGEQLHQLPRRGLVVRRLAFSPDSQRLAVADDDRTVRLWDVETMELIYTFSGHKEGLWTVAFSTDGSKIISTSNDRTARVWDAQPAVEPLTFTSIVNGELYALDLSADGNTLATGGTDAIMRLWDFKNGTLLQTLIEKAMPAFLFQARFSPDGQILMTSNAVDTSHFWSIPGGEDLEAYTGNGGEFSSDGKFFIGINAEKWAILRDAQDNFRPVINIQHPNEVASANFSPDGSRIITGGFDGTIYIWQAANGEEIQHFVAHADGAVTSVVYSLDGRYFATSSADFTAKLWDAETGTLIRQFTGHIGQLYSVAFSPDGKSLLTASADRTARLWDVETGIEIRRFVGHTRPVARAIFTKDGSEVITASHDGTVRVWQVNLDGLIRFACEQLPRDFTPLERDTYLIMDDEPTCPSTPN